MAFISKNPKLTTTTLVDQTSGSVSSPPSGSNKVINRNGILYLKSSAGVETPLGSGASAKNYLSSINDGSAAATLTTTTAAGNVTVSGTFPDVISTWYRDSTSSIATSTNSALRGTSNYLTAAGTASASGATFVQTPAFNIDGEDLGKALAVQFDVTGNTTADDWDCVAVRYDSAGTFGALIPIAGVASTTTGTASAQVPTGTTTFKGFFITGSTASDVYSIRWRKRAGAVEIRLDNLIVGPNSVMMGTAITDWQSYTPTVGTISGYTTSPAGYYRRIGDSIEIYVRWVKDGSAGLGASVVTVSIPTGLLIDTTKSGGTTNISMHGYAEFVSTIAYTDLRTINYITTSTVAIGLAGSQMIGTDFLAGTRTEMRFMAPIVGYSSNVTMADRAVEEFASNASTNNGDDTATPTYANGPSGSQFVALTGATTLKKVKFNTPILLTDTITLEYTRDSGTTWGVVGALVADGVSSFVRQTTLFYGMHWIQVSNTTVNVEFGGYRSVSSGAYGAVGNLWSGVGPSSVYLWRLRKVAGGSSVGFPVGARNVIGDTTGTAVPAGYIGETKYSDVGITTYATTVNQYGDLTSISLTPGVWSISGAVCFRNAALLGATSIIRAGIGITSGNNAPTLGTNQKEVTGFLTTTADNRVTLTTVSYQVVVSATATYYLKQKSESAVTNLESGGFISAVRIA
jgi:hypothetical protein